MPNTFSLSLALASSQFAYINDASQTGLDITGDITLEAWYKAATFPATNGTIICKDDLTGVNKSYILFITSTYHLQLQYSQDGGTTNRTISQVDNFFSADDLNEWHHIAVAVDVSEKTAYFYKDGVLQSATVSTANATSIFNSSSPVLIGAGGTVAGAGNFVNGEIDEVRIWNTLRTQAQIQENYRKEIPTHANLKAYWQFNNLYTDKSGNSNTLTSSGSPSFTTDVPFNGDNMLLAF